MKCSFCSKKSVYNRKYSGKNLCKKHFLNSIEKKVKKTIKQYLGPRKRIGLAVSGGKDSLSMAFIIKKILDRHPYTEVIALIVNEGLPGYRDESINRAVSLLEKIDIPYIIGSLKDLYSFQLVEIINEKNRNISCTYCGVFRRRILEIMCKKADVDILFTGHNASDIAQTIFLNIVQGNLKNLIHRPPLIESATPRVYPLKYILESEVTLYAYLRKIDYYDKPCPFTRYSLRNDIRNFLSYLEQKRPGITYNIVRLGEKLKNLTTEEVTFKKCKKCGFPTTREECKVCEILATLNLS